jgi:flagellar basal-body rod modification protein FlgD
MTVGAPTSATSTATSSTSAATGQLTQNYNTFLKMLTTQLKNQDPTAPMDSTQFTQQLVMYSQVEQQINTNSNLQQLISATNANQAASAVGYIGMQVDAPGSSFTYSGQPIDLGYALPSSAASAAIKITDDKGNVVWTDTAQTAAGNYNFTWNGIDASGNPVSNGTYNISLVATDSSNAAINGTTSVPGIVQGVQTDNGTVYLTVNGNQVPESSITNVTKPGS